MDDDNNSQELLKKKTKELKKRLVESEKLVIAINETKEELDTSTDALKILLQSMEGEKIFINSFYSL